MNIDAGPRVRGSACMELPKRNEVAIAHVCRHYNTSPQRLQHDGAPPRDKATQFLLIIKSLRSKSLTMHTDKKGKLRG